MIRVDFCRFSVFLVLFFYLSNTNLLLGQLSVASSQTITIIPHAEPTPYKVIQDLSIYAEKWDKLAQPRFWQQILKMDPELSIINIAETRETLNIIPSASYDDLGEKERIAYKDSLRALYKVADDQKIYVTSGKKDYYQLKAAIRLIGPAIDIFKSQQTNPWYAQAILLIESPGIARTSSAGASGYFQLMKSVARSQGLTVTSVLDERQDFAKSAKATATFLRDVCIPETKRMLKLKGIAYKESDLWFRLLVMHVYHAGSRNVSTALSAVETRYGGMELIRQMWQTEAKGFKNASQNYSQIILASLLELDHIIYLACDVICPPVPEPGYKKRLWTYQNFSDKIGGFFYSLRQQSSELLIESPFLQTYGVNLMNKNGYLPEDLNFQE